MHSEQRKEVRTINAFQPKGKLQVLQNDSCITVFSVKDISPTGIRLEVNSLLAVGDNIRVRYVDDKVDIKLNGTVAWNSDTVNEKDNTGSRVFQIGIRLASPSLLYSGPLSQDNKVSSLRG